MVRQQRRVDVDDPERVALDHARRQYLHVAREHHQVELSLGELLEQEVVVRRLVGRRRASGTAGRASRASGSRSSWLESTTTRSPFRRPASRSRQQLLEAVGLLASPARPRACARAGRPPRRSVTSMPISSPICRSPSDQLVERAVQVGEVDQHGHDEEPFHDPLLDVLDVDVARRRGTSRPGPRRPSGRVR